jgi:hypothetical protein
VSVTLRNDGRACSWGLNARVSERTSAAAPGAGLAPNGEPRRSRGVKMVPEKSWRDFWLSAAS